ncbi:MAG: aspartate--tRNA ligase [Ignavibacteria bacterium]|nr:aspartate--tRNA ligase [Ignavibacteria bacterium]
MQFSKRTHTCGELRLSDLGKTVVLNGWVSDIRDLGKLIFVNIRDRFGVTQVTFTPELDSPYNLAKELGLEYVVSVSGKVQKRTSPNPSMPTGEIEILAEKIEILNSSETPPFVIEEDVKASEELRFRYRYLDMRRRRIADNLILRNRVYHIVHKYFEEKGFIEVETPILMKSTPEGARDYLVPSRIHKGKFYALPQSPQTYKQILMIGGIDRYVQICKCFRDEDLRADRQPEFTQIDLEMSFVDEKDVFNVVEGLICRVWKEIKNIELPQPFKIISYDEAISKYGSDKPDLRIKGISQIENITSLVKGSGFRVFDEIVNSGGVVACVNLVSKDVTRKLIDQLTLFVKEMKVGGLAYIKYEQDKVTSPLSKYIAEETLKKILAKSGSKSGDTVFILSGEKTKIFKTFGELRLKLAEMFNLTDNSTDCFLWVNDFPLFAFDEEESRFVAEHHPFTMPHSEDQNKLDSDNRNEIESIRALSYDLVCNGSEFGSGSIRIHKREIQEKVFRILNLGEKEQKEKFGFLLDAFRYGAPPHGGFALGFDRIVATLCGTKDIRETIAFPKTTSAVGLMDNCPSEVDEKQLRELGIKIIS